MKTPLINPFRLRILIGICVTLFVGTAVFAMFGPRKFGPLEISEGSCLLCGRQIQIAKFTGSPRESIVMDTEVSAWVDRFVPATHEHVWSFHSGTVRSQWFGGTVIGCGGGEPGVEGIWLVGRKRGWATAESLLREYIALSSDNEARGEFIADAVSPRLTD